MCEVFAPSDLPAKNSEPSAVTSLIWGRVRAGV